MGDFWTDTPGPYVDLDRESRKFLLHPWLRNHISHLNPRRILDYGAGDGSLFAGFDCGYERLLLYDHSAAMLSIARTNFANITKVSFSSAADDLHLEPFDLVVCSLVLMTIQSDEELKAVCSLMFRATIRGGRCLVAVTHPCFRQYPFSTFSAEFTAKPFPYMNEGTPFRVRLTDAYNDKAVEFTDYHWSMSYTVNLLIGTGFQMVKMVELPDKAYVKTSANKYFPAYLVLDLCKPY